MENFSLVRKQLIFLWQNHFYTESRFSVSKLPVRRVFLIVDIDVPTMGKHFFQVVPTQVYHLFQFQPESVEFNFHICHGYEQ